MVCDHLGTREEFEKEGKIFETLKCFFCGYTDKKYVCNLQDRNPEVNITRSNPLTIYDRIERRWYNDRRLFGVIAKRLSSKEIKFKKDYIFSVLEGLINSYGSKFLDLGYNVLLENCRVNEKKIFENDLDVIDARFHFGAEDNTIIGNLTYHKESFLEDRLLPEVLKLKIDPQGFLREDWNKYLTIKGFVERHLR